MLQWFMIYIWDQIIISREWNWFIISSDINYQTLLNFKLRYNLIIQILIVSL